MLRPFTSDAGMSCCGFVFSGVFSCSCLLLTGKVLHGGGESHRSIASVVCRVMIMRFAVGLLAGQSLSGSKRLAACLSLQYFVMI